jgi:hypothetical protein
MYAWTAAQAEMSDTVRPLERDQVKPYYQEWVRRLGIGGRGRIYTATVRFLSYFTAAIHLKRLRPLHLGRTAVVGDFPCLVGVPHRSGRRTPVHPAFCGNIFLMAGTPSWCTKKARTFSFTYEAWKKT